MSAYFGCNLKTSEWPEFTGPENKTETVLSLHRIPYEKDRSVMCRLKDNLQGGQGRVLRIELRELIKYLILGKLSQGFGYKIKTWREKGRKFDKNDEKRISATHGPASQACARLCAGRDCTLTLSSEYCILLWIQWCGAAQVGTQLCQNSSSSKYHLCSSETISNPEE